MPISEKVQLVTELWDQIAKSGESITLPGSVIAEAERRLGEMTDHPSMGISEEEMWHRADAKR
ncbi:MAG: addiction module protein [Planctomycetaceae bacterium]